MSKFPHAFLMLVLILGEGIAAQTLPRALPDLMSDEATVVAIATLSAYHADPATIPPPSTSGRGEIVSRATIDRRAKARGTFTIRVLNRLRGKCPETLDVNAPPLRAVDVDEPPLRAEPGQNYLIFMKRDSQNRWISVETANSIVPVTGDPTSLSSISVPPNSDGVETIVAIFVNSLKDAGTRHSAAHALQDIRSESAVKGMFPFIDDPDTAMRRKALGCLATNQVVAAIPKIVELDRLVRPRGLRSPIGKLMAYQTPEATPLLNPLLMDDEPIVRLNAATALHTRALADKTTIPYLIKVLKDPSVAEETAFRAHIMLHRLIAELGAPKPRPQFLAQVSWDEEIRKAEEWLADEQAGKHGDTPPLVRPRTAAPPTTAPGRGSGRGPAD